MDSRAVARTDAADTSCFDRNSVDTFGWNGGSWTRELVVLQRTFKSEALGHGRASDYMKAAFETIKERGRREVTMTDEGKASS